MSNALIPMMGKPVELGNSVRRGAVALGALDAVRENRMTAPSRLAAVNAQTAQAEQEAASLAQERDVAAGIELALGSERFIGPSGAPDPDSASQYMNFLERRRAAILSRGGTPDDTEYAYKLAQSGEWDKLRQHINQTKDYGYQTGLLKQPEDPRTSTQKELEAAGIMPGTPEYQQAILGGVSASEREFSAMTAGMSPEDIEMARRINLGLDPRAMGSSAITIQQQGLTQPVAASQAVIKGYEAGAAQDAKNASDAGLTGGASRAEIEAAVAQAKESAKREAALATTERLNGIALDVYQTGMSGLQEALGETASGPIAGRLPAVTANAQIAEGAIAAVAPVLKQMFRAAGEGVFTDRDQQLLLDMVPKRTDHPEAQAAKIQNIDAIVRAKLGSGTMPTEAPAGGGIQEGATAVNPQTGQRIVYRNGAWVSQ